MRRNRCCFQSNCVGFCINNFNPIFSDKFRKNDFKSVRALTFMLYMLFVLPVRRACDLNVRKSFLVEEMKNEFGCCTFSYIFANKTFNSDYNSNWNGIEHFWLYWNLMKHKQRRFLSIYPFHFIRLRSKPKCIVDVHSFIANSFFSHTKYRTLRRYEVWTHRDVHSNIY